MRAKPEHQRADNEKGPERLGDDRISRKLPVRAVESFVREQREPHNRVVMETRQPSESGKNKIRFGDLIRGYESSQSSCAHSAL